MKILFSIVVFFSAFAPLSLDAQAATFVVNTTDDTADATPGDGICATASANCSLRAAISEANALAGDDIITLPAGTYTQVLVAADEDLNAGGDWDIRSNITINGAGAATTILQAAATPVTATERVVEVLAPSVVPVVTISGVTLRHGNKTGAEANATRGGGIRNNGTLTMNDCIVTLNNASGAGGIRNDRAITLNNVTVSNNGCNNGGTTCFGGGMYSVSFPFSTVTINNSTFTGNTSTSPGTNGFGSAAGMGIESFQDFGFNLVITGSTFSNNQGIGNGTGGGSGNGIRVVGIFNSTARITNSSVTGNFGTGGSFAGQGITVLGGAECVTGQFNTLLDRVTVDSNTGGGIGLFSGCPLGVQIVNSTVSNNDSGTVGGGIAAFTGSSGMILGVTNSTISGNTAPTNGGGVYLERPSPTFVLFTFTNVTVAGNTAGGQGGGIAIASDVLRLKNSIIANNAAPTGPDVVGSVDSLDYNHFSSTAGATIGGMTTNNATGDPMIGPLANNGGPTLTRMPAAGSPVVNTIPNGTNDCGTTITTDQRGVARPSGGSCDKGSVERSAVSVPAYIAGQIRTPGGRGIRSTLVTVSGGNLPAPITIQTGSFGLYRFDGLETGQTYTIMVEGKRFTFSPSTRTINLMGNLDNEDFISQNDL